MAAALFLASLQVYIVPVKYSSDELLSHEGTIIVHGGLIATTPCVAFFASSTGLC